MILGVLKRQFNQDTHLRRFPRLRVLTLLTDAHAVNETAQNGEEAEYENDHPDIPEMIHTYVLVYNAGMFSLDRCRMMPVRIYTRRMLDHAAAGL